MSDSAPRRADSQSTGRKNTFEGHPPTEENPYWHVWIPKTVLDLIEARRIKTVDIGVLYAIRSLCGDLSETVQVDASPKTIAEQAGVSESTVRRSIRRLNQAGLIDPKGGVDHV